ncbi:hypothetical protein Tco_0775287 [Tanacetum coccineum]
MVVAGGNLMRKTLQEAYDLIENMTQHHFQWDAEMYYDTTLDMSAHYSNTTYASRAPVEVLGKQTAYTIQSVQHQPRLVAIPLRNPTPSSDFVDESSSSSPIPYEDSDSLVEEADILPSYFDDSPPEYETFSFDIKDKSSGNTTTHYVYSLPDYEAFYFDDEHIEEKISGSTTTHSDIFLPEYDSFIFDLSIDPFPPADRSDYHHEEFADELAHIISSPKYDCFYFDIEPDLRELAILFEENISKDSIKELTTPGLNDLPLLLFDCDSTFSEEFSEIDPLVSFPSENKAKIFDPEIFIIK